MTLTQAHRPRNLNRIALAAMLVSGMVAACGCAESSARAWAQTAAPIAPSATTAAAFDLANASDFAVAAQEQRSEPAN